MVLEAPSQQAPYNWFGVLVLAAYALAVVSTMLRRKHIGRFGLRLADDADEVIFG